MLVELVKVVVVCDVHRGFDVFNGSHCIAGVEPYHGFHCYHGITDVEIFGVQTSVTLLKLSYFRTFDCVYSSNSLYYVHDTPVDLIGLLG